MMTDSPPDPAQASNSLGKASLMLGILGSVFVFCIGLCAGAGQQQGWLTAVATPLGILGGTSAFIGFLAVILGLLGLLDQQKVSLIFC